MTVLQPLIDLRDLDPSFEPSVHGALPAPTQGEADNAWDEAPQDVLVRTSSSQRANIGPAPMPPMPKGADGGRAASPAVAIAPKLTPPDIALQDAVFRWQRVRPNASYGARGVYSEFRLSRLWYFAGMSKSDSLWSEFKQGGKWRDVEDQLSKAYVVWPTHPETGFVVPLCLTHLDAVLANQRIPESARMRIKAFLYTVREQGERSAALRWEKNMLTSQIELAIKQLDRRISGRGKDYAKRWLAGLPETAQAMARLEEIEKLLMQRPSEQQT